MSKHWVVTGLMGAGKTTIGRLLAQASGRVFIDNDEALLARTGRTARDIRDHDGFDALHREERETFAAALRASAPAVIAAAASTVDDPATRDLMHHAAHVIWLRAPAAVLAERVRRQAHRPLDADAEAQLAAQVAVRSDHFAEVADVVVDASRPAEEVVAAVLDAL